MGSAQDSYSGKSWSTNVSYGFTICLTFICMLVLAACSEQRPPGKFNKKLNTPTNNTVQLKGYALQASAIFDSVKYANASFARGGLLYDNWFTAKTLPAPGTASPVWSLLGHTNVAAADTWRCSSCHGWDYLGVNGAFGDINNQFHTGITGVVPGVNQLDPQGVFTFIRDGLVSDPAGKTAGHNFVTQLSDVDIYDLTLFVMTVRQEAANRTTPLAVRNNVTRVAGNAANGARLFSAAAGGDCASCHGVSGTAVAGVNVRLAATTNPALVLHRVRFGIASATAPMPGVISTVGGDPAVSLQRAGDLTTFAQHGVAADHVHGGRLYDDWIVETGIDTATMPVNPLWSIAPSPAAIPAGADTDAAESWRCSTCHGYDYEGGNGFDANNLVELKEVRGWAPGMPDNFLYVYNFIMNGFPALVNGQVQMVHNYMQFMTMDPAATPGLSEADAWDLADFTVEETLDTHQFLQPDTGSAVGGSGRPSNSVIGAEFFNGPGPMLGADAVACGDCHGADGMAIAAADIPMLAWSDPWRVFHRIRFGVPRLNGEAPVPPFDATATIMPGILEMTKPDGATPTDNDDAMHVQSYIQLDLNGMGMP